MYNDYNFVGMNFIWWIIWMGLLSWIFLHLGVFLVKDEGKMLRWIF